MLEDTPVHLGLAGPASPQALIRYAMQCGVTVSGRMLAKNANARKLLTNWQPDALVNQLIHADTRAQGLHIYPFGGMKKAVNWLSEYC